MGFSTFAFALLIATLSLHSRVEGEICAGCPIQINPDENGLDKMVNGALATISTNSVHPLHLIKILHATSQVVSGVKYTFDVQVGEDGTNDVKNCRMVFLSQPWITKESQLLSEDCSSKRTPRQLLGGLKDVDSSEMGTVQDLANYAITTLDDIDADDSKQVVVDIIDAKKQLVNGIMYHLELRIRTTGCKEGHTPDSDCLKQQTGETKHCKIQVHRSFADKSPFNAKVVKSECEPMPLLGGIHPIDVNDDALNDFTDLVVQRVSDMTNSMYVSGLVQVIKASSQVVEGMKYYLTLEVGYTQCLKNNHKDDDVCKVTPSNSQYKNICNAVVWTKPWEKFTKILSVDCQSIPSPQQLSIKKERAMTGGAVDIDPLGSYAQDLSKFSISEMDKQTNSDYKLGVNHIIRATSQVVSGVKITLTMDVGETTCKKGEETNDDCKPSGPSKKCTVVIWDRPWMNDRRILSTVCHENKILNRQLRSGETRKIDVNDNRVKELLPFTAQSLTDRINSDHTQGIVRVIEASTQIVAGSLTNMKVEVSDTDCLKMENKNPLDCHVQSNGVSQICDVSIWNRPWLHQMEMTSLHCHPNQEPVGI